MFLLTSILFESCVVFLLSGWSYLTHGLIYLLSDYTFSTRYYLCWLQSNHEWFLFQLIDIIGTVIIELYKALYSQCLDSMYSQPYWSLWISSVPWMALIIAPYHCLNLSVESCVVSAIAYGFYLNHDLKSVNMSWNKV